MVERPGGQATEVEGGELRRNGRPGRPPATERQFCACLSLEGAFPSGSSPSVSFALRGNATGRFSSLTATTTPEAGVVPAAGFVRTVASGSEALSPNSETLGPDFSLAVIASRTPLFALAWFPSRKTRLGPSLPTAM